MSTCLESVLKDVSETERKHSDSHWMYQVDWLPGEFWGEVGRALRSPHVFKHESRGPFLVAIIK